MKFYAKSVLLLALVAITTQDITGRKSCDCSICRGVDNKINPFVGKRSNDDDDDGKSSCSICERRKEILRMEREKQQQLQKCPFEILGSPNMRGKTSEEIFDDFREMVVPSQNGFFDMMRGVVRTMHGSSVAEVNWAKEKEARELAKRRKQQAEEAKKRRESSTPKGDILGLNNPLNPKVTVVLKQTPCGNVLQPQEQTEPEKFSLTKRFPKEINSEKFPEEEVLELQPVDLTRHRLTEADNSDINLKEIFLHSDLVDHLIGYKTQKTTSPLNENIENTAKPKEGFSAFKEVSTTESPFVKFISNDEMKALMGDRNSFNDFDMGFNVLPTSLGVDKQNVDYSNVPFQ